MDRGADGAATGSGAAAGMFAEVPGGAALIRHFGRVPDFDGDGILRLVLDRDKCSILQVHARVPAGEAGGDGAPAPERHATVSFVLSEIVDLQLDGFHAWNELSSLILRWARDRPGHERRGGRPTDPGDVEIELVPRHRDDGPTMIRARSVEITMEPGKPIRGGRRTGDEAWLPRLLADTLRLVWDPLALGQPGAWRQYNAHVPELVGPVRDAEVDEDALAGHLARIEVSAYGLTLKTEGRVRAARALLGLRDARRSKADWPVRQWANADGRRCVRIVETPDGLYAYEERALRRDGDGGRARWVDVGTGRSGLFATAAAAEREARHRVGWLRREGVLPGPLARRQGQDRP